MEAIDALAHQKTIILIAHRLSTVKNCDQIVLLEKGQIKAKGKFEELAQADQQFREMAVHV
jgi:ABC-type multidrug transport system fused ATPase/permease subunit